MKGFFGRSGYSDIMGFGNSQEILRVYMILEVVFRALEISNKSCIASLSLRYILSSSNTPTIGVGHNCATCSTLIVAQSLHISTLNIYT
jgi:hypothetical protein